MNTNSSLSLLQGGMLLGPSGLGRFDIFTNELFPVGSFLVLDSMAHFALIHYAFLLGLEKDLPTIRSTGKKALTVAVAGFVLPLAMGSGLFFLFAAHTDSKVALGLKFQGQKSK